MAKYLQQRYVDIVLLACMIVCVWLSGTLLEMVATLAGLLCVWLTAKENIWCWPIGLINVGCFFFIFYEARLYADMMLQVIFFILSIQGWIIWLTKRQQADVRPTKRLTPKLGWILVVFFIVLTFVWGYMLSQFTSGSIPYLDALIATLSIFAQFLLSSKILENWYVWIVVDVLSIGMYVYKDLYSIAFLYGIFLVIAVYGLLSWKKVYVEGLR
jgi:nicotinamide mononucleotide transporter